MVYPITDQAIVSIVRRTVRNYCMREEHVSTHWIEEKGNDGEWNEATKRKEGAGKTRGWLHERVARVSAAGDLCPFFPVPPPSRIFHIHAVCAKRHPPSSPLVTAPTCFHRFPLSTSKQANASERAIVAGATHLYYHPPGVGFNVHPSWSADIVTLRINRRCHRLCSWRNRFDPRKGVCEQRGCARFARLHA